MKITKVFTYFSGGTKKQSTKKLAVIALAILFGALGLAADPSSAQAAAATTLVESLPPKMVQQFKMGEGTSKIEAKKATARKVLAKQKPKVIIKSKRLVSATGYSSTPGQTSGNPFITASGKRVHWGTVASNELAFGTKIRIPQYYGDKIFIVEDTGGFGYGAIDIWFDSMRKALSWGRRAIQVEIIG